jgi:hypothetical protein
MRDGGDDASAPRRTRCRAWCPPHQPLRRGAAGARIARPFLRSPGGMFNVDILAQKPRGDQEDSTSPREPDKRRRLSKSEPLATGTGQTPAGAPPDARQGRPSPVTSATLLLLERAPATGNWLVRLSSSSEGRTSPPCGSTTGQAIVRRSNVNRQRRGRLEGGVGRATASAPGAARPRSRRSQLRPGSLGMAGR